MTEDNLKLQYARKHTPSRRTPGACLGRQELAELVNEWIYTHRQRTTSIDKNYIGKLENGRIHWPDEAYRAALRAILGAANDAQLGFYDSRRMPGTTTAMELQRFLDAAANRPDGPQPDALVMALSSSLPLMDRSGGRHQILDAVSVDTVTRAGIEEWERAATPATILNGIPERGVEETNRRQALATGIGAAAGLALPNVGDHQVAGSAAVDRRLIESHVEVADTLASMYRSVDPRAVLSMAATYADELLSLYDSGADGTATDLAVVVVGVHCQVGLWACHAHQPARARRYLATAYDVAAGLGDRELQARTLGALAYLHSSAPRGGVGGNPRRALDLLGRALALAVHADGFTRGWLATWRADQHATLGDLASARADLELADATLDADDGPDSGFFARRSYGYGMQGHLNSVRGLIYGLADQRDEAERAFASVQAQAANARRRIASYGHLALAYVHASEPEAACKALEHSLTLIETEPYPMGLQRVLGVRARFEAAWTDLSTVRDLDQRLASLAPARNGLQ